MVNMVALIPARAGSKRIVGKNVRPLAGHPLLAYTIAAARESAVFGGGVYVSTDSLATAEIAKSYGADVILRPESLAADMSPDIEWVVHVFRSGVISIDVDSFAILRPTSPFRTVATIRRAFSQFIALDGARRHGLPVTSLRAVERAKQHPLKMWTLGDGILTPLAVPKLDADVDRLGTREFVPAHSRPTQSLPEVWSQNASLEMAWRDRTVGDGFYPSITGGAGRDPVAAFITEGYEGFDLNHEDDWLLAEALLAAGRVTLPDPSYRRARETVSV